MYIYIIYIHIFIHICTPISVIDLCNLALRPERYVDFRGLLQAILGWALMACPTL